MLWIRICKDSCLIRSSHIRGRSTLNDVECFRNEPVHELYSLKASQICKVHTNSYEITNEPYVSSYYVNIGKTVTADLTTNYDAETNTSLAEKIKNVREQSFEGGANNNELDKDTDKSNLNSKVKYLSLALPLNIQFLLLVFVGFNISKVRFGTSYIITFIIVQAIVNVGLLYVWSCMYLVEDMNTLDDCDLLEKVVNMTNVHEHNDVTVSIKVQQFRSRHAKYVHYNCTRVLCACRHGYKRDREPSRVPMKMLKRPSEKSRKLQNYVQGRFSKNVPKSSEVHDLIKNNATRKKSTQESGLHKK